MENKNYTDITHLLKKPKKKKKSKGLIGTTLRLIVLIIIFVLFSLVFSVYDIQNNPNPVVKKTVIAEKSQVLSAVAAALPVRLIIPQINVNADIKSVGVTPEGSMDVPSDGAAVGWFKLGPRPGEKGSSVIAGHLDSKEGEAAVFANLSQLKKGDIFYILDDKEKSISFVVRESRIYDPGYADDVFSGSNGTHLNLITCDGVWDGAKKSYSKRLVVFADIVE